MPKNEPQKIDLERLKTDPYMWMRLCTPKHGVLGNVFKEKENPFAKEGAAAMERVKYLAEKGKLYLRDTGRSRHFHKLDNDGDSLKQGEPHEMKMTNQPADIPKRILMWMSKHYFSWLGWNGVSKWFERKLEREATLRALDKQYKKEYKQMPKEQREELYVLRKQEKLEEKRDALQRESDKLKRQTEKAEKELAKLREEGKQKPKEEQKDPSKQEKPLTKKEADKAEKARIKAEKARAKREAKLEKELDKLRKQSEKIQDDKDDIESELRGLPGAANKGELESPLSKKPEAKPQEKQPSVQEDQPSVQQQPTQNKQISQQHSVEHQFLGKKKEGDEEKKINEGNNKIPTRIVLGNKEYTEENMNELPEAVREGLKQILKAIEELDKIKQDVEQQLQQQAIGNENQQQIQQQQPAPQQENVNENPQQGNVNENPQQENENENRQQENENENQQQGNVNENRQQENVNENPQQENVNENPQQENVNENPQQEIGDGIQNQIQEQPVVLGSQPQPQQPPAGDVPQAGEEQMPGHNGNGNEQPNEALEGRVGDPPNLEPGQVNMQERPADEEALSPQERFAAEKQAIESAGDWRTRIVETLLSNRQDPTLSEYYNSLKQQSQEKGDEFLVGMVAGILSNHQDDPQKRKDVLDALLDGRPLGPEYDSVIENGASAFNGNMEQMNKKLLGQQFAFTLRTLAGTASEESTLSPRLLTIGRLLSAASKLVIDNDVAIPMQEEELQFVGGAASLADITLMYHEARYKLGSGSVQFGAKGSKSVVRDLMMGNAVEQMLVAEALEGGGLSNVQQIMGQGLWSVKNLQRYTSKAIRGSGVTQDDVSNILHKRFSSDSFGIGRRVSDDITSAATQDYDVALGNAQRQMEQHNEQLEQPMIGPNGGMT